MIAMQIMFGDGCDTDDVQTAEQIASHECHFVGDYCDMDIPIFGCMQKVNTYCCFNSMMARIIQEQGRPQLTTYGPTGNWGSAESPNCKGLTPEEFEALDFSKIDFSEYIANIQLNLTNNIQNAQNKIQGKIQSRVQQIQNP
jgi:conjugal transfer mating pair stabilization protein TraN